MGDGGFFAVLNLNPLSVAARCGNTRSAEQKGRHVGAAYADKRTSDSLPPIFRKEKS
jgi:hypothetical protein